MRMNIQLIKIIEELQALNILLSYTREHKREDKTSAAFHQKVKREEEFEDENKHSLGKKLDINKARLKNNKADKTDNKDIITIIDESFLTDELDDAVKQVAVKMDGFDRVFLEQYQRIVDAYKRFLDEYLNSTATSVFKANYDYTQQEQENKQKFTWGEEIMPYITAVDVCRRIQLNALMDSRASQAGLVAGMKQLSSYTGHNKINQFEWEDYETWKWMSKFNMVLSFWIYEKVMNGG